MPKRRKSKPKRRRQRAYQHISKPKKALLASPAIRKTRKRRFHDRKTGKLLQDNVEDRRYWTPLTVAPLDHKTIMGATAFVGEATKRIYRRGARPRVFLKPNRTIVCTRRAIRRAILFSKGRVGQGKRINRFKDRVLKKDSHISCRRR